LPGADRAEQRLGVLRQASASGLVAEPAERGRDPQRLREACIEGAEGGLRRGGGIFRQQAREPFFVREGKRLTARVHLEEQVLGAGSRQRSGSRIFGKEHERSRRGEPHQAQERSMCRDHRCRAPGLGRLPAEGDEPFCLRVRPPLQLASLLRALRARADALQHWWTRRKGRTRGEPAREHHVPARRAIPCIDVAVLRQQLQLGEGAVGRLVPRER